MQDGNVHTELDKRLGLVPNGSNGQKTKSTGLSLDQRLGIAPKQDSFQDDTMKDVSNKMEDAVKQQQLGYFEQIWQSVKQPFKTFDTSLTEFSKGNVAEGIGKLIDTGLETFGAVLSPLSVGSEKVANMLPEEVKNLGMSRDVANTINFNLTKPVTSISGGIDKILNQILPETAIITNPKTGTPFLVTKKDILNLGVPENVVNAINRPIRDAQDLAVNLLLFKKGENLLKTPEVKSPISPKRLTELRGEQNLESPTNISPKGELRQPSDYKGSEVGDTKINLTPQEELAISKDKLVLSDLTNKVLELTNKQIVLTEQLKKSKTKANKTALQDVNKQLEDITAERNAIEDKLNALGAFAEQRQIKGLLPERGTSSKLGELDEAGVNSPSFINFTAAKDPLGRSVTDIAPDRLQPVKTSVHDYLVERGLDLFSVTKADKPLDPTVLGDILNQAKENGIYDPIVDIFREEAFKRGKVTEFENALSEVNKTIKVSAEEVKPDVKQIGEAKDIKTPEDFRNATTPEVTNFVKKEIGETEYNKIVEDAVNRPENKIPVEGKTEIDMQAGAIEDAIYAKAQDIIYGKNKPVDKTKVDDITRRLDAGIDAVARQSIPKKEAFQIFDNYLSDRGGFSKRLFEGELKDNPEYVKAVQDRIVEKLNVNSWDEVPQTLKVYRGEFDVESKPIKTKSGNAYQNYSLSKDIAQQFAGKGGKVYEYEVNKDNIKWATQSYLMMNDMEVIINPKDIKPIKPSNRIISDDAVKRADDYLKNNLSNVSSNPFVDVKLYGALLTKGAYHFENGVIRFSEWSKKMVEEYGDKVKPVLIDLWNEIKKDATLKQTAVTNSLPKVEKTNKLNTAINVEANAPVAMPFQHNVMTKAESLALNTMGKYVEKQGEAGKNLVDAGNKVFRESSQLAAKYLSLYHNNIMSLNKFPDLVKEFIKIANQGGESTNPLVMKALDTWKTIRTEIAQKSAEQEMTMSYFDAKSKTFKEVPFAPIKNFFPHKFDFDKIRSAKFKNQFIDNLASKLDVSRPEAERIWNQYIRRNTINEMKNIERVRQFDIDGWREELSVIPEYIQEASRRLKEVEIFGKDYQKANGLISEIDKAGGDYASAQTLFDKWVGRDVYDRDLARYVSKLNSWQALNKLGLLNLLNWTQIGNAGMLFSTKSFAKTLLKQMRDYPELRKYVEPTGALDNSLAAYQLDSMSSAGIGDFMLRKTGVVAQERWNRVFSANVGMDYMKDQLKSLIRNPDNKRLRNEMQRKIDMLNLTKEVSIDNALKNGKFTEKELLDIGYEGARKTQFLSRPQDLPDFMSRKGLKFFTLFKSFVIQQSSLVKDAVLKELFKGNIKPLLFMATVFPALGEIANTARAIVSGDEKGMKDSLLLHKQEWSKIIGRYALDLATIGSFGYAYDIARASAYSPQGLAGWLAGANVSDLGEGLYAGLNVVINGSYNPLLKFGARQIPIPIVKQQIGNILKESSSSSSIGSRGSR